MSDNADWRDVTPTTPGFEYEVQTYRDGRVRNGQVTRYKFDCYDIPANTTILGTWKPGWPGKGLQW